jgi:hypothetical protein
MKTILAILGIVLVTGVAAHADVVAVPPQKLTLTGTLGWSTEKRPDGQEAKAWLTLTTADGKANNLLRVQTLKNPAQYDPLVGKKVVVTATGYERKNGRGDPEVFVVSVTDIKAAPATKR